MLTKAQIQRIAQRNEVGMQVQERDYVQHLLLWLLYSRSQVPIVDSVEVSLSTWLTQNRN